jgi:hypothetical protein
MMNYWKLQNHMRTFEGIFKKKGWEENIIKLINFHFFYHYSFFFHIFKVKLKFKYIFNY